MTKNAFYEELYMKYQSGLSLSEVGKLYGVTRQSVYSGFKRRGYTLRSKNQRLFQVLDGIKFTLRNTGYYSATTDRRIQMHRYVWEKYYGKIPYGYDIHHKDHNRSNNSIDNLALYSKSDHARLFSTGSNKFIKRPYKDVAKYA